MAILESQEKVVARTNYYYFLPPERTHRDHARLGTGSVYLFAVLMQYGGPTPFPRAFRTVLFSI